MEIRRREEEEKKKKEEGRERMEGKGEQGKGRRKKNVGEGRQGQLNSYPLKRTLQNKGKLKFPRAGGWGRNPRILVLPMEPSLFL